MPESSKENPDKCPQCGEPVTAQFRETRFEETVSFIKCRSCGYEETIT